MGNGCGEEATLSGALGRGASGGRHHRILDEALRTSMKTLTDGRRCRTRGELSRRGSLAAGSALGETLLTLVERHDSVSGRLEQSCHPLLSVNYEVYMSAPLSLPASPHDPRQATGAEERIPLTSRGQLRRVTRYVVLLTHSLTLTSSSPLSAGAHPTAPRALGRGNG